MSLDDQAWLIEQLEEQVEMKKCVRRSTTTGGKGLGADGLMA
jgi:hypothetical protein